VTRGREGASLHPGNSLFPAARIDPVNTTGAGDAFSAALGLAVVRGEDVAQAIRRAVAAGTAACLKPGTSSSMPTPGELQAVLEL
jgi:ribokinase